MRIQRTRKIAATFLAAVLLIVGIVPTFLPSGAGTENTGDSKLLFTKKLEIVNSNKYATTADVEEEGNSGFNASKKFTLTDSNYYKRGANFFLFRDVSAGIDFSEVGNKGSYVFWLKTPRSVTLTVDIQLADFSAAARFKITTTDETDWQKVTIAQSDITLLDDKFDFDGIYGLKASVTKDDFLNAGESMYFGIMEAYGKGDDDTGDISVPELIQQPGLWRDGSLKNYSSIETVAVTDNESFSTGKKFTVLNQDYYNKDTSFYFAVNFNAQLDYSAIGKKGFFKFWIKTPHRVAFKVEVLHTASYLRDATFEINTSDSTEWQEICISRQDKSISDPNFDFRNLIGIKLLPVASLFLKPEESILFGQLEIYDEALPSSGEDGAKPKIKRSPGMWRDGSLKDYSSIETVGVTDNDKFATAQNFTVLNDEYYDHDASFYIFVDWSAKIDLSAIGKNGYIKFWIKTPHSVTFKVEVLHTTSYLRDATFEITTSDSTDWQEINILREDMSIGDPNFDFKNLIGFKAVPKKGTFLNANEKITFGQIEIYDENIGGSEENPGHIDLGEIKPDKNYTVLFDAQVKNGGCGAGGILVKTKYADTSLFEHSLKVTMKDSEKYFSNLSNITFYTTYGKDINVGDALENGYFELWIKTPRPLTMDLVLSKYWPTAKIRFTTAEGTGWQKIRMPVADFVDGYESMSYNGMILIQLAAANASSFIADNESFEVGRLTFFCPNSDIGSSGADETYPISEDKLTRYEGTNFLLTTSTHGFWAGEPSDKANIHNEYAGVAKDDVNYYKFKNIMRMWLVDVDEYYAKGTSGAMVYIKRGSGPNGRVIPVDVNDYILTGTLRVWIKVTKKMTFNISLRNGQANDDIGVSIPVTIEPTAENNGFKEIQIPLKDYYDKAVKENIKYRFDKLDGFHISPVIKDREHFLDEGDEIIYSTFELWAKEAPEPVPAETKRTYTCSNGNGVILIDENEIMPETTVVNTFRNTVELNKMKHILSEWSKEATLVDTYCIQAISDNKTDARLTQPYDKVKFSVPLTYLCGKDKITTKNISALNAVFYSEGVCSNAKLTVEEDNLIIETSLSGDLIFFSGKPGKDGRLFDLPKSDNDNSAAVDSTDDSKTDDNTGYDDEDDSEDEQNGTKKYKKVIRRKKNTQKGSNKIIWLSVCIVGAVAVLVLGFFGYKKFIAASLSLFLILGLTFVAPITGLAADEDVRRAEIRLLYDHPGVPGYDAEYETIVYYGVGDDLTRLSPNEYTLHCDLADIKIDGIKFIVPASFKDNTDIDGFKIYATVNSDKEVEASYPLMVKNWKLEVQDDFDGTSLNTKLWSNYPRTNGQIPQDNGKYCQAYVSEDCVTVKDGKLEMRILDGKDGTAYSKNEPIEAEFLMPRITSKGKVESTYGCYVSSIQMPHNTSAGSNSGFWLLPTTGNWGNTFLFDSPTTLDGFSCGELDIIEYSPAWGGGKFQSALHWWDSATLLKGSGMEMGTNYPKFTRGEYVEMACTWTENSYCIYYDGILQRKVKNLVASGEKAYVLFTMQTAGYNGNASWTGMFTKEDLPEMVCRVDYFKLFS